MAAVVDYVGQMPPFKWLPPLATTLKWTAGLAVAYFVVPEIKNAIDANWKYMQPRKKRKLQRIQKYVLTDFRMRKQDIIRLLPEASHYSEGQVARAYDAFLKLLPDPNNAAEGRLSKKDSLSLVQRVGLLDSSMQQAVVGMLDPGQDGIDFLEFLTQIDTFLTGTFTQRVQMRFRILNPSGSGKIRREELVTSLRELWQDVSLVDVEFEVDRLFAIVEQRRNARKAKGVRHRRKVKSILYVDLLDFFKHPEPSSKLKLRQLDPFMKSLLELFNLKDCIPWAQTQFM